MNIKIAVLDRITSKFSKEGTAEYSKRLSKYCKIAIKQYKNEEQLIRDLNSKTYIVAISTEGSIISSEELAEQFSQLALSGRSDVTFIMSEASLSPELKTKVNYNLAISKLDIEPNLLLVTLLEQIYRAYRINNNEPYHK